MAGLRPALRMARRDVRRNLARSILVAALVGLPVAGATFVDVLYRSDGALERSIERDYGEANALLTVTPYPRLTDYSVGRNSWGYGGEGYRDPATVDLAPLLPRGTELESAAQEFANLRLETDRGVITPSVRTGALPYTLRPSDGRLREGRFPEGQEVALSPELAEELGVGPGGTISDAEGTSYAVSGVVRDDYCFRCSTVYAPGFPVTGEVFADPEYLAELPPGVDQAALAKRLAEQGVMTRTVDMLRHPERFPGIVQEYDDPMGSDEVRGWALSLFIVGLGLLEVVLLAGGAFAVGARKQIRTMGLIGAGGGSPRQLRLVLLTQGATLGLLGAAGGVALGLLVARLGWPLWEHLGGGILPVFSVSPVELAVAAAVGVVSGVLAAVVPAVSASRMQPIAALAGRFRVSGVLSRRTQVVGVGLLGAGAVCGVVGDRRLADGFATYAADLARVQQTGVYVQPPTPTMPIALVLLGATLAIAGLVLLMPTVLDGLARLGHRLPLPGRLAVRDAARQRHRTGPAASAIMVAVAGSVVMAYILLGTARLDELRHVPNLPPQTMSVSTYDDTVPGIPQDLAERAAAVLPGGQVVEQRSVMVAIPADQRGPEVPEVTSVDFMPVEMPPQGGTYVSSAYADPEVMRLALGRDLTDAEHEALAQGKILVTDPYLLDAQDRVHFVPYFDEGAGEAQTFPALLAEREQFYGGLAGAFVPEQTAKAAGWKPLEMPERFVTWAGDATDAQVAAAVDAVRKAGGDAYVAEPRDSHIKLTLLIAGLAAAVVTLMGVAISVALSASEGRADLATLSAVGAAPRLRRALAGSQALVIAVLGSGLGVLLGSFVSWSLRASIGAPQFEVPWANLVGLVVGVPLVALLLAAAVTPSRLPLVRRLD